MFLNTQSPPKASKFPPMHELVRQNQVHPQQVQQRYVGFEGVCIPSCLGQHKGHWTQNNSFQRSLENPKGFVGVWVCFKFPSSQSNWERWQLHCFFFYKQWPWIPVSGSDDGTVRVWSPETGEMMHLLQGHERCVWSLTQASSYFHQFGLRSTGIECIVNFIFVR